LQTESKEEQAHKSGKAGLGYSNCIAKAYLVYEECMKKVCRQKLKKNDKE